MTDKARDAIRLWFGSKGIPRLNGEMFRKDNHENDNSIILHFSSMANGYYRTRITGYTEHPAFMECNGYGIMFESPDGRRFWCHMREEMLLLTAAPELDED